MTDWVNIALGVQAIVFTTGGIMVAVGLILRTYLAGTFTTHAWTVQELTNIKSDIGSRAVSTLVDRELNTLYATKADMNEVKNGFASVARDLNEIKSRLPE